MPGECQDGFAVSIYFSNNSYCTHVHSVDKNHQKGGQSMV